MIVSQVLDNVGEIQEQGRMPVTGIRQSSMLLVDSSEYQEGEVAFRSGLTTRNNPYPFLSPESWRWQEGLLGNGRPREWTGITPPRGNRAASQEREGEQQEDGGSPDLC